MQPAANATAHEAPGADRPPGILSSPCGQRSAVKAQPSPSPRLGHTCPGKLTRREYTPVRRVSTGMATETETGVDTITFEFTAHRCDGTGREIRVTVTMQDDDRPLVDIQDDAYEQAVAIATHQLGSIDIEVVSY